MYKCKAAILDKLQQVKLAHKRLNVHKDQIILEKSGRYSMDLDLQSFITSGRSIFQYALKEIEEAKKVSNSSYKQKLRLYEDYISEVSIIRFFIDLRDEEIHVGPSTHQVTVEFGPKGSEPKVKYQIMKRCKTGPKLYRTLSRENRQDLIEGLNKGGVIYEPAICDDQDDLLELCQSYLHEIEKFINFEKRRVEKRRVSDLHGLLPKSANRMPPIITPSG